MTDNTAPLVERLDALMEWQRQNRGDYMDYGRPDEELMDAKTAILSLTTQLTEVTRQRDEAMAALRKIAEGQVDWGHKPADEMRDIATAALAKLEKV